MEEFKERLKVTGQGIENARGYITVSYRDEEYRVPKFYYQQKSKWCPEYVNCVIKELGFNSYKITQDLAFVVPELYKKGGIYPFTITAVLNHTYQITDENGLRFRLTEFGDKKLELNRKVQCEVTDIQYGFHVIAKLVEAKAAERADIPFVDLPMLTKGMSLSAEDTELLEKNIFSSPYFSLAKLQYESQDIEWLLTTIKSFDTCLSLRIESREFLNVFKNLSLYLIEGSNIFNNLPDEQRTVWMNCLTAITQHAEDYQMAYDLIDRKEANEYVCQQLNNLKESENLYQPDRKFRTILCIFNSDATLMEAKMDEIFEIILQGKTSHWQAEPFRSAFVNMLEIFISKYKDKALSVGLSKLIKALAIQLKLSKEGDGLNRRLNKSMLYRFISQVKKEYSVSLLDKSLESLLTPYDETLEYEWEDISNIDFLYTVVAAKMQVHPLNNVYYVFRDKQTELLIEGNNISIRPQKLSYQPIQVVPKNQLQWNNLKIYVNEKPDVKLKGSRAISTYKQYWDAVENNLFTVKTQGYALPTVKETAHYGELVWIWVEKANPTNSSFLCHIEMDEFEGSGWLDLKGIVGYVNPSPDLINCFTAPNGEAYILPAKVNAEPDSNGMYHFSMIDDIKEYYFNNFYLGDKFLCKIQDETPTLYIGFTANGFSVRIPKMNCPVILQKNDVVVGRLIDRDKQHAQLECEYVDTSSQSLNPIGAFHALLDTLSSKPEESQEVEDGDTDNIIEEVMDKTTVKEIVSILDRMAVLMQARYETYNFLAVSSILSRMIGDHKRIDYYRKRKSILLLFDEYEKSGKVDEQTLLKIKSDADNDLVDGDSVINNHITLFTILKAIEDKSNLDELYSIYQRANDSEVISKACSAAMTLLLMSDFNLPEAKKQIFDALNAEVGVKFKTTDRKDYGRETQTVEFKTSIIYPAGNRMRPYPRLQEIEIMKVVCSFLNSDEGGTLYIGVNNYGVACGLDSDFKYLGLKNLESYGLKIHHKIFDQLGALAADCCKHSDWEKADGYDVFKLTINPCPKLVAYNGKYYVRFNTEKRIIKDEDLPEIRSRHSDAYAKWEKSRADKSSPYSGDLITSQPQGYRSNGTPAVVITDDKSVVAPNRTPHNPTTISTSAWRKNVVMSYEDDYMLGVSAFIHFYDGYMFQVADSGTNAKVQLSLAISEAETDGYIVVAYKSGKILVAETSKILSMQHYKMYKRCNTEETVFACPARKGDAVLTVWSGPKNETSIRIDDISSLIENHHDGSLSSSGKLINEYMPEGGFLRAEIVKEEDLINFNRFRNKGNNVGYKTSKTPADIKLLFKQKLNLEF